MVQLFQNPIRHQPEFLRTLAKIFSALNHPFAMRASLLLFCFCAATLAFAQKKNAAFRLHMHKASSPITVDGVLDEQAWTDAEVATNFFMMLPMDTSRSRARTDVRMT